MTPRILHVHSDLVGGGIEKSMLTLATRTAGDEVAICWCPTTHPVPSAETLAELQQHVQLLRVPPPLISLPYPFRLGQVIRRFRPDVLHLHGASLGVIGGVTGRLAHVPVIVYTEHCDPAGYSPPIQRGLRATRGLVHHIVCVSEQIRASMLQSGFPQSRVDRLSVIHNGVDLPADEPLAPAARQALRAELGLPVEGLLIGSVGLLWYIKGYDHLIAALPAVVSRFPQAALVLVGSGQDEAKLRAQAEALGMSGQVHFLGWRGDVPRLLRALDVYVQPSISEGLAISVLEAAGTSLPIVASDVGGMPEIIESEVSGLLTPPHDPAALSAALISLLADEPRRTRFGTRARAVVEQRFSTTAMVTAYQTLYQTLLAARGR